MLQCFYVDFVTCGSTYIKIFTIRNFSWNHTHVIRVKPPENWDDIVFKQLPRNLYVNHPEHLLDWTDGDIDYNNLFTEICKYIDPATDLCFTNNVTKVIMLEHMFNFSNCYKLI
jgi:hypothetical protein